MCDSKRTHPFGASSAPLWGCAGGPPYVLKQANHLSIRMNNLPTPLKRQDKPDPRREGAVGGKDARLCAAHFYVSISHCIAKS